MCGFSFHLQVKLIILAFSQGVGIGGVEGSFELVSFGLGGGLFCLFLSLAGLFFFIKLYSCSPKTF